MRTYYDNRESWNKIVDNAMAKDYGNWVEKMVDGKHIKVNTSTGEVRMGYERIVYEGEYVRRKAGKGNCERIRR